MRRVVTVLVVLVVAAIAMAAGIDALRGGSEPQPAAQTEPASVSTEQEAPAPEKQLEGTLYYTDEGCELQAIELPRRTPVETPTWGECQFVLSPDTTSVSGAGSAWDPTGDHLFHAEGGRIVVLSSDHEPEGDSFSGTAPAWRPDGTLTYFADGAVRAWPDGGVILSQRDLLWNPGERSSAVLVREAAWLDQESLAVISSTRLHDRPDDDLLAVFRVGQVTSGLIAHLFDEPGGMSELRVSPGGHFAAVEVSGRQGQGELAVMNTLNGLVQMPGVLDYRAIAWSPDDVWTAIATSGGVTVLRSGLPGPPELELDLDAHDLAWRGDAGPPTLADTNQAREWLGRVAATGRLFLTDSDCKLRALRLPSLAWEDQPDRVLAPCRFNLTSTDEAVYESIALQPQGQLRAYCEGDDLDVYVPGTSEETVFADSCGPAWMADGRLTFIHQGELYAGEPDGDMRLLTSRTELVEMFGRAAALEELAWLDDKRFWAVVRSGENAIVALMTTDRLVFSPSFVARRIEGLRVSATGMVAARTDQGIVFFDSGGRRALTFPNGRAVAWAPGELIAAVAMRDEVLFVAPVSREVVTMPLAVRDLEWVVP